MERKAKSFLISAAIFIAIFGVWMLVKNEEPAVPEAVITAFTAKYPGATEIEWEIEDTDEYEAEFELDGTEMSANFSLEGKWLVTETSIEAGSLPTFISSILDSQFSEYEVEKIELIEKPGAPKAYEVMLENESDDLKIEVVIDERGVVLEKKAIDDKGKEEE